MKIRSAEHSGAEQNNRTQAAGSYQSNVDRQSPTRHPKIWQHKDILVCAGGPADGRLVPGDQLVKINNVAVDDLTPEQAAEIIRFTLIVFSSQRCAQNEDTQSTSCYYEAVWLACLLLLFFNLRECQESLTMTILRTMLVSQTHLYTLD